MWLDIFNPDLSFLADPRRENVDPHAFFVPSLNRAVWSVTTVWRKDVQVQHCTFHYAWFDERGSERKERIDFDMTYLFPRELEILLQRNGLRVEKMFGNYDGSTVRSGCPRIIARCCPR